MKVISCIIAVGFISWPRTNLHYHSYVWCLYDFFFLCFWSSRIECL